jgi:hypothetical protein
MQAKTIFAGLLALALVGPAEASAEPSAEPVGFVAGLRGRAELRTGGSDRFEAAELDRDVSEGDTLRTGRQGWAKIVLRDDTTFAVDEETEVVFDHYTLGSLSSAGGPSRVDVLKGHVRTKIGETFGDSTRLKLRTPTAVVGVKGTEWLTWVEPDDTWICVIEGIVDASNRNPAIGVNIDVGPGQCARIGRDQAPSRAPSPEHLKPTAMRQPLRTETTSLPARIEQIDRTPIEPNDIPPRIEIPDPTPVRTVDDTPPPSRNNNPPPPVTPPPVTFVP